MTSLRRLFAVVLWHAGFAPCERIERHAAITYIEGWWRAQLPAHIARQLEVNPESGCWEWTGTCDRSGYGKATVAKRSLGVHRIVFLALKGEIPAGLDLDHLCRNRRCANPDHLEPVTKYENWRRGQAHTRLNLAKTHCPAGHPYDEANTRVSADGKRACRICNREAAQRLRQREALATESPPHRGARR